MIELKFRGGGDAVGVGAGGCNFGVCNGVGWGLGEDEEDVEGAGVVVDAVADVVGTGSEEGEGAVTFSSCDKL